MVRNPESKPRISFGDRLRRLRAFGEKTLAIIGMASTAIVGVGCNNSEVNDPNSNITPDTAVTDTQEIPLSPEPHNTEPPSPEMNKKMEIKGLDKFLSDLDQATDFNEKRRSFIEFTNSHANTDSAKLEVDELGRIYTSRENLPETMKKVGEHNAYGINLLFQVYAKLIAEGKLDQAGKVLNDYLDSMTVGQARQDIETFFNEYKEDPQDKDLTMFNLFPLDGSPEKIFEASGREGSYPTQVRNNFNNEDPCSEKGDLTRCNGLNYGSTIPKNQVVYIARDTRLVEITSVVNITSTTKPDDLNYNPSEHQSIMSIHGTWREFYITPVMFSYRTVSKYGNGDVGSEIPLTIDGEDVPAYQVSEIQEAWNRQKF